eukprot:TRINITY_DN869_c4_g1_i1.p1 TRINITY_DN869_c4_g1~~TRINITY_DN869_c4_g1_i1.p1  ORF type:complete len:413 (+),score=97.23 TRINITY_DN869_c4_g1_i1:109-1347(+)
MSSHAQKRQRIDESGSSVVTHASSSSRVETEEGTPSSSSSSSSTISVEESKLYDRQIRLWGVAAQNRMRNSKVLTACIGGVNTEICKNLILAGVGGVTMMDDKVVDEADLAAQFFLAESDVGKNRAEASLANAQSLNPMVNVVAEPKRLTAENAPSIIPSFDAVCIQCSYISSEIHSIAAVCRSNKIPLIVSCSIGLNGLLLTDFDSHTYTEVIAPQTTTRIELSDEDGENSDNGKSNGKANPEVKKPQAEHKQTTVVSPPLNDILARAWDQKPLKRVSKILLASAVLSEWLTREHPDEVAEHKAPTAEHVASLISFKNESMTKRGVPENTVPDELLQSMFASIRTDLSPVCAVLGGIAAQEVIKIVTGKDAPLVNYFGYNGITGAGETECVTLTKPVTNTAKADNVVVIEL